MNALFARCRIEGLSKPEMGALEAVAQGETAKEYARRIHRSEHTIKTHISHLLQKLNAKNSAQAVAEGMRRGYLK